MGQEEWGHKKLFTDPLPPSSNRDKIHFSRGELINTLWPLLILSGRDLGWIQFSFNIIFWKLPKAKDNDAKMHKLCGDRNTKMNMGHGTKKIWPLPHKNMSPFDELKKGDFFYPPPSCTDWCPLLSNFFLKASLNGFIVPLCQATCN